MDSHESPTDSATLANIVLSVDDELPELGPRRRLKKLMVKLAILLGSHFLFVRDDGSKAAPRLVRGAACGIRLCDNESHSRLIRYG